MCSPIAPSEIPTESAVIAQEKEQSITTETQGLVQ